MSELASTGVLEAEVNHLIRQQLSRITRGIVIGLMPALLMIGASGAHPASAVGVTIPSGVRDIVNSNGKCLSEENVGVVIDVCDNTARQDWDFIDFSSTRFLIQNNLTGNCLSILNNNKNEGAQVNTHSCNFSGGDSFELWTQNGSQIANVGDGGLVMHPSGCGSNSDLLIFMNDPGQCKADDWALPGS